MDKARKFGWHGYVDSLDSIHQVMEALVAEHVVPSMELKKT